MVAQKLREELDETRRMSEMYREQVIGLEDDIAGYREKEHHKTDLYKVLIPPPPSSYL